MHCAEVRQQDIYVNETPQFRVIKMWVKPEEVLLANALWYVFLCLCIVLDEHLRLKCLNEKTKNTFRKLKRLVVVNKQSHFCYSVRIFVALGL